LSSEKFKSIWPLPGGATKYVNTLTRILKKIQENNPTFEELLKWFISEYELSGEKTPRKYLECIRRFGFFKRIGERLSLAEESLKFLESGNYKIVYEVLDNAVLGLDDSLSWLSEETLSENEIHARLIKKYNLNWKTRAQTHFRLCWLRSLGYINKKGRKYHLTDEGLNAIHCKEAKKPPLPVTVEVAPIVIPTSIEKYISHAPVLIKKRIGLSSEKFKGIWPLYGGMRNYVVTLRKILERVNQENPTMVELISWLRSEYKASSETVPYGMLRVVKKCLGFMEEIGGRVKLTPAAEEFLRTGENRLVLDALRRRVLGFEEILSMLAESQRLSLMEIHKRLLERCNLDWTTTTQTMYRLNWLISLNFVAKEYGKYRLTGNDLVTEEEEKSRPPSTPPPTPIYDYIKHVEALIERHPTMSKADTIPTLIKPLLKDVLGWDIRDPDEVQMEYPIHIGGKTEYVDIALKVNNRPVVFIEAKSVDTPLRNHLAEQPINYANAEGVSWCVLANGRELRVYNAFWRIRGIEQKMLFKLSIDEFKEKMDRLELLSREAVTSGRLDEDGGLEHAKRMILEWLRQKENFVVKDIKELDPSLKEEYIRRVLRKVM